MGGLHSLVLPARDFSQTGSTRAEQEVSSLQCGDNNGCYKSASECQLADFIKTCLQRDRMMGNCVILTTKSLKCVQKNAHLSAKRLSYLVQAELRTKKTQKSSSAPSPLSAL